MEYHGKPREIAGNHRKITGNHKHGKSRGATWMTFVSANPGLLNKNMHFIASLFWNSPGVEGQNFRRTKFSAPSRNFATKFRRNFFISFLFPHTIHMKNMLFDMLYDICINLTCFRFQGTKYFGGQNFRRTKFSAASKIVGSFVRLNFIR